MYAIQDSLISKCNNWESFEKVINGLKTKKEKGDLFERFTQLYLMTHPNYFSVINNVWQIRNGEIPKNILKKLNLPQQDEGIDLVCETTEGKYWSVQCKFRSDNKKAITTSDLSKFSTLSFVVAKGISFGIVAHTSEKTVRKANLLGPISELGLEFWLSVEPDQWDRIHHYCSENKLLTPVKRLPRPHQKKAINDLLSYFSDRKKSRCKLLMPCATGKTLTAFWATRRLNAKKIVLAVPSLTLLKQNLSDWIKEYVAEGINPKWLAVCSDSTVGQLKDEDSTITSIYELGIETTTDEDTIKKFLAKKTSSPKIIFTTYQSADKIANAVKVSKYKFDLLIADEAHRTVGHKNKFFSTLLYDEKVKFSNRIFMTATERIYLGSSDEVVSMDNKNIYGEIAHNLTFKKAIEQGIICDYEIITQVIGEPYLKDLVSKNKLAISTGLKTALEAETRLFAAAFALNKAFNENKAKQAVTFHRSVNQSIKFHDVFSTLIKEQKEFLETKTFHISGKKSAGERKKILTEFNDSNRALVTNAKCLTEGVDIPSIDCVMFSDPKDSVVDIVQAAGRALRRDPKNKNKKSAIIIPVVVPEGQSLVSFADSSEFKSVIKIIAALSTQDERVAEYFKFKNKKKKRNPINIDIHPELLEHIDLNTLMEKLENSIWKRVGRANWKTYAEAEKYIQSFELKSNSQFRNWLKTDYKQYDFPANPDKVYEFSGWSSWGIFLGTGNLGRHDFTWPPIEEIQAIVRKNNIKSSKQYSAARKNGVIPKSCPTNPQLIYADTGWPGWGLFLGTNIVRSGEWLPFDEAKQFVHKLKLRNGKEWANYTKSGKKPVNIPALPYRIYPNEYTSLGDWLGYESKLNKKAFWSFQEARSFLHSLKLTSVSDLRRKRKDGRIPNKVPTQPNLVYEKEWVSWGDWIGTNRPADGTKKLMSFKEAQKFAKEKKISTIEGWANYLRKNPHPQLVRTIDRAYRKKGWVSWAHFFGKK